MTESPDPPAALELRPSFPALDSLRAVGALAVLTTHTTFQTGDYFGHGLWGTVFARLDVGVAIFFVLSGFLLSRPWLARARAGLTTPAVRPYYGKRFRRIYPVYLVTVVIALTLIAENDGLGAAEWARTLLLANTYFGGQLPHGLTQMWSLAVEVAFYAVLPWLMLAVLRRGLRVRLLLVVLAGVVVLSAAWHLWLGPALGEHTAGNPLLWLPAFLSWFAVGIGLALAHVLLQSTPSPGRTLRIVRDVAAQPGACWAMAAGLLLVAATPIGGPVTLLVATSTESTLKNLIYAAIGGLVVMTGVFTDGTGSYARAMSAPLPRHLGHISYSTFCIHLAVLSWVMTMTGSELFLADGLKVWSLTLVISLAASELLYRLVELPGQRRLAVRLRHHGRNREGRPADQANTADSTTTTR